MRHAATLFVAVLLLSALYLSAGWRAAGEAGLPLDDAWIHARLARNLGEGRGFVFNPEESAAVSSAPLWTLLLAVPAAAGVPFPWASYLVGIAATVALATVAYRLSVRATGDSTAALLCSLIVIGTHPFPWSSLSGMEAGFSAALVLGIVLAAAGGRTGVSLGLATAAGAARPELALLPVLVLVDRLARLRPHERGRTLRLILGAAGAVFAPFLLDRILTGQWLPGSFEAKVGRHGVVAAIIAGRADRVPETVASNLFLYLTPLAKALLRDNGALLLLAPLGFRRFLTGAVIPTHLPWMITLLLPCAVAVLAPFGGPAFHEQRYIAPIVATVVVSGAVGLVSLRRRLTGRTLRGVAIAVVVALTARGAWRGMERYAGEVRNITEMQVKIGRWLRDRPGGPGTIATNDIGAIGYFTGAPILDLTGLASPEAIPYLRRAPAAGGGNRGWNGASEAGLLDLLRARRPEYVALFPSWYPSRFLQEALGPAVYRVDLDHNLICGDRTMIVYRPSW